MPSQHDTFSELFRKHHSRLFKHALGLVRSEADAQDIVQQTAITAWQEFDTFDPSTDFFHYAVTIANLAALQLVTRERACAPCSNARQMAHLVAEAAAPTDDDAKAELQALSACLAKLSPSDAKIVEYRYHLGLGSRKISELLNRPQTSVCNSLRRIRANLARGVQRRLAREGVELCK